MKLKFKEENLEFYECVLNFERSSKGGKELAEEAQLILKKYLGFGDLGINGMCISISQGLYQDLKKIVDEDKYHLGMFSKVKIEVIQLLECSFTEYKIEKKNKKKIAFIETSNRVIESYKSPYKPK